ncbi:MAG: hypothetical protein GY757_22955 [bacterium]|nr:hypothetical protein [bacterium]
MEFKEFKKICYPICIEIGARVSDTFQSVYTPNFHAALIQYKRKEFFLLGSVHDDWAFCSKFDPYKWELDFIDCPVISTLLKERYNINTLSIKELNGPFVSRAYFYKSDIKCWRPQTLGEGLFNWWD